MDNHLLQGVRVVDLSQFLPGPYATHLMATLGATVLKVEPPGGDPMRELLRQPGEEFSILYGMVNAGKRIVRLDLKSDAGKSALRHILADADVLLDGYRPGVLGRLGFDSDQLTEINPGLITCALSGYGQSGPYGQRAGQKQTFLVSQCLSRCQSQHLGPGHAIGGDGRQQGIVQVDPGPPSGPITVKPGGKLVLVNVTLHNDCDEQWQGVFVQSQGKNRGIIEKVGKVAILDVQSTNI